MIGFGSDNHSGVHPQIMEALVKANKNHAPAYGTDPTTIDVCNQLREVFGGNPDIYPVFNGTAANVLCLKSLLKSHHSILCADTSHLHMDECGAPENIIGCKLQTIATKDGKLRPKDLEPYIIRGGDQHFSQPKMLSITQPTELGTVYSLDELKTLREWTHKHNLYMHVDGARFIYAAHYLNCSFKELTSDIGIDVLSFGGTKNALLFGELCVLFNNKAKEDFKFLRKQNMQLPSKMRFISAQIDTLINQGLWREITAHCHKLALLLHQKIQDIPEIKITQKTQANSVFACIPKPWIKPLRKHGFFYVWDEVTFECRLMTSFDMNEKHIDHFVEEIHKLRKEGVS